MREQGAPRKRTHSHQRMARRAGAWPCRRGRRLNEDLRQRQASAAQPLATPEIASGATPGSPKAAWEQDRQRHRDNPSQARQQPHPTKRRRAGSSPSLDAVAFQTAPTAWTPNHRSPITSWTKSLSGRRLLAADRRRQSKLPVAKPSCLRRSRASTHNHPKASPRAESEFLEPALRTTPRLVIGTVNQSRRRLSAQAQATQ